MNLGKAKEANLQNAKFKKSIVKNGREEKASDEEEEVVEVKKEIPIKKSDIKIKKVVEVEEEQEVPKPKK
jgi:hypothetical protein